MKNVFNKNLHMSVFFFVTFLLGYYIRYWTKKKKKKSKCAALASVLIFLELVCSNMQNT